MYMKYNHINNDAFLLVDVLSSPTLSTNIIRNKLCTNKEGETKSRTNQMYERNGTKSEHDLCHRIDIHLLGRDASEEVGEDNNHNNTRAKS